MKLSAAEAPPGTSIFLNGHMVHFVTEADEEAGRIDVLKLRNGDFVLNDEGDAVETITLHGDVVINLPPAYEWLRSVSARRILTSDKRPSRTSRKSSR